MNETFIIKSSLKDNYSIIPNDVINNGRLSSDCLAVLVYLLSKPSNWVVKPSNIQNRFGFGKDKAYKVIADLIQERYIIREEVRTEGKYAQFTYYVYDSPFPCLPDTAEPDTANKDTTKYRDILSKEKIQMAEQDKPVPQNEWQWYKNWLAEYTSFKEAGDIVGQLLSMAFKAGYKTKEEKDKLVLAVLQRGAENKPEGNVRAYLFKIFQNITTENKYEDKDANKWQLYAQMWQKGNWYINTCPRPDDPSFVNFCPKEYQHLFERNYGSQ
tara:strand:- start:247 stop:1056 length:810 start_codon:yes stop_codon:yes gene_type:complete